MSTSELPNTTTPASVSVVASKTTATRDGVVRKRWTREEYYKLGEQGWFQNQRTELIDGEIVLMVPQSFDHAFSGDYIAELLRDLFGKEFWTRHQVPLTIDEHFESEPDVSVVQGTRFDYTDHPTTAVLVVEIAKTTLAYDTRTKPKIYARAKVTEYWVLDLEGRRLLVHREPVEDSTAPGGHRYKTLITLGESDSVSPLEKPDGSLAVSDMLLSSN